MRDAHRLAQVARKSQGCAGGAAHEVARRVVGNRLGRSAACVMIQRPQKRRGATRAFFISVTYGGV